MARATPERGGPQTGGGAERSRSTEPHGAGSGGLRARLRASSLWWKVSAGFLFAAALPVGVFALVQHRTVSGLRLAQARAELEHDTEQLADRIEQALAGASELAAALARNPDVVALGCGRAAASSGPAARAQALLQTVVAAGRLYAGAALTGGAGRIVVATDPDLLGAAVEQAFGLPAHPAPCRGIHLGEDRRGGRLVVVCAPVAAGGAGQAAASGAGQVLLLLAAPRLFAEVGEHPNDDRSFAVLGGAGAPLWGTVAPPQAEVERVVVPLGAVPWAVTGMVPRAVLLAPLRAQAWRTLGVAAAVALAIGAAGALLAWGVTRRLSALEQAARIAARGQLEVEIDPGPPDEIGRLAAAWQRTLAELGRAQRELAATEAALRRHAEELEQRVAERTRELAERARHAEALARAARELGDELHPDSVVQRLVETAVAALGTERGLVFLADERRQVLQPVAAAGIELQQLAGVRVPLVEGSDSINARAFLERRVVALEELLREGARPEGGGQTRQFTTASGMSAPIAVRGEVIGTIGVYGAALRVFGEQERTLLEAIAHEAGVAFQRARLIEQLAERERDLRDLFEGAGDVIFAFCEHARLTRANRAAAQAFGLPAAELRGRSLAGLLAPGSAAVLSRLLADLRDGHEPPCSLELTIAPAGGGEPVPLDVSLRVARRRGGGLEVQAIGRDLRPRRALEQRTMQAERLRTAIQLAGAAAHHINQPLTGIIGFCDLLLASEACSPEQREMVAAIRQQAERIAEIVARMRGMTQVETENYLGQVDILKL